MKISAKYLGVAVGP